MQDSQRRGRIIHCADYGGPYSGSFVPMLAAAAHAARGRGYATTVCFSEIARGRPWLSELGGVADVRFIGRGGRRGTLRQLRETLNEPAAGATIMHTHFGTFDETAALLRVTRRGSRVLWHAHSARGRPVKLRTKVHSAVFGRMIDGVICVSPLMWDEAVERGLPAGKLRLLANAVDPARFPPIGAAERAAARRALDLPDGMKVVLHFAWDWQIKGGDRLLSVAKVMDRSEEVTFLTVIGEHGGGAPREELERHRGVRAIAPQANVNELYAAADAFLNCSRAEGLPYAVIEALARGLPAVVTTPPVRPEVVAGLPGGRSVAPDPRAIAGALDEVLTLAPADRVAHAAEARARVESSYALDAWAQRLVDLYDEALGR